MDPTKQNNPSSTSTSATKDPNESYTTMSTADVDSIGAHCQAPYCRQLDFLPFRCDSCDGTYCLDHRTETSHSCPKAGEWARRRAQQNGAALDSTAASAGKPNILTHESQCSKTDCKTLINTPLSTGVHCEKCKRDYCLKHRFAEDHACDTLPKLGVGSSTTQSSKGIGDALGRLKAWSASKKSSSSKSPSTTTNSAKPAVTITAPLSRTDTAASTSTSTSSQHHKLSRIISPFSSSKPKSTSTAAQLPHLNALKTKAKGDAKIPSQNRLYVHLEAVSESNPEGATASAGAKIPRADAFYDKNWSVGKVLDAAAKTLGVVNVNNRGGGEEERLRVFWIEGGRLLGFGEKLGQSVKDADTLVLLRGVGTP